MKFFVSCPKGIEQLLQDELTELGINVIKQTIAGVYVEGDQRDGLNMVLWSRLANRVVLIIHEAKVEDVDDLYVQVKCIDWDQHLDIDTTFACVYHGKFKGIDNTLFGALKVKDGICDYFSDLMDERPDVDRQDPDVLVSAFIKKGMLSVGLDFAKGSLHRRGYRKATGDAPMKENLAAAVLLRAGWPKIAAEGGNLIDPMCGTGTLLLEAAQIAGKVAPGLGRINTCPDGWLQFDNGLWSDLLNEARQIKDDHHASIPNIIGYDMSNKAVFAAGDNVGAAGMDDKVKIYKRDVKHFKVPTHFPLSTGLVISNPPYGVRLSEAPALARLYQTYAEKMCDELPEWKMALFTAEPDSCRSFPQRLEKKYPFLNGDIPTQLLIFAPGRAFKSRANGESILSEGAQMFANRIKKNLKKMKGWIKQGTTDCYRIYDADLPEYSVAVDVYGEWLHVQEYMAPKSVDPAKADRRIREVLMALPEAMDIDPEKIVMKQRKRQEGKKQYEKNAETGEFFDVTEGQATYRVNLKDYLDTGVFLDHRWARKWMFDNARDKRVLNLFCYTGTASVQAAKGKAKEVVSVDMSRTYLNWAMDNFRASFLTIKDHQFIQEDCMKWLQHNSEHEKFDLIFIDPPTFSNSKRMEDHFDVQEDHVEIIHQAMNMLMPGGKILFSNNMRNFKLDKEIKEEYTVENVTEQSIPKDFERNKRIHQCYIITD